MQEMNFEVLQENIRSLLEQHDMTQDDLAKEIGMSQSNVSKALNRDNSKQFTVEQLFRIAQYFKVSIDVLVGNTAAEEASISQRAIFRFITDLLRHRKLRTTTVVVEETVFEPYINHHGCMDCDQVKRELEYTAFYFSNYLGLEDYPPLSEYDLDDLRLDFNMSGNESGNRQLNDAFQSIVPILKLYCEEKIEVEPLEMILKGYLEKLPE